MTTESRVLRAEVTLRTVHSDLMRLAEQYPDEKGRRAFKRQAERTAQMLKRLERRHRELRREEPEYVSMPGSGKRGNGVTQRPRQLPEGDSE